MKNTVKLYGFNERDFILFHGTDQKYVGGIKHFEFLSAESLEELVSLGFADVSEQQNNAPTLGECLEFCKSHPEYQMHGYAVSPERDDAIISIEGIQTDSSDLNQDTIDDFLDFAKYADEVDTENYNYCWFD